MNGNLKFYHIHRKANGSAYWLPRIASTHICGKGSHELLDPPPESGGDFLGLLAHFMTLVV